MAEKNRMGAAELYAHLNERLEADGRTQVMVHYHLGFDHATESLADILAELGASSATRVLDVCCGWGVPTRYLAGRFGCKITGVDITQRSIDLAKEVTRGTDVESLIDFRQGDAQALPLEDGSVDLVWSQDGMCHVPDRGRALAEFYRVLKPGGHLAFTDWMRGEYITPEELSAFCEAWSFPKLETQESYPALIRAAGFEVLRSEEVGREYAAAGEQVFLAMGIPSFIQRTAIRDSARIAESIERYGMEAHLEQLEREKMDIYFAQGKMALGRFVCAKPA